VASDPMAGVDTPRDGSLLLTSQAILIH
jgi:hypothetical protein